MASNYLFNNRDHNFIFKEWLDMDSLFSLDAYKDYYTLEDINFYLDLALRLAKDVVAPTNEEGDKIHAQFVDGKVITPPSFKSAYKTVMEAGMGPQFADRETAGKVPLCLMGGVLEILSAANPSLLTYWGLTSGAAGVIQNFADEKSKQIFLPKMFSGEWGGTMNLTEPGAGSDLGNTATRAYPTDTPGIYRIKGSKQFITAGDHDMVENVIHLVLARIEGCRPGTAGISLFMVPKYRVNDDGSMGEFNDVQTIGIEHKMGYRGSATCSLAYGENNGCQGILIGSVPAEDGTGQGMMQMFHMMNEERLNVCGMALSQASSAYHNSVQYAKERIQGKLLTDPKGPRVAIIKHEDIRRMLSYQKAVIEAIRAMQLKTLYYIDIAADSPDEEEREFANLIAQINTPLCKAYTADMTWKSVAEAIQIYGGYGFIEDYPVAQAARDCKIHSIWEGTNYIQALDLVGRKFMMGKGQPFMKWLAEIGNFIEANKENATFTSEFKILTEAFQAYQGILGKLGSYMSEGRISMMPLFATRILHSTAMIYCSYLILSQGILGDSKLKMLETNHYDLAFYQGKVASARFYIMNILPEIFSTQTAFATGDNSALEIPEEAF